MISVKSKLLKREGHSGRHSTPRSWLRL